MSFTELGLNPTLLSHLEKLGYNRPAPTHTYLLPHILKGTDMLVSSAIGAGVTEAALFALLHQCMQAPDSNLACVILTPTKKHTTRLIERMHALAGNAFPDKIISDNYPSTAHERSEPLITISTPRQCLAQLREGASPSPTTLLLVETDEIIARGAKPALLELADLFSTKPQVLICTGRATRSVKSVSKALQREPLRYTIKPDGKHPASIPQQTWPVPAHLKTSLLVKLYRRNRPASVVVITSGEATAARLARRLRSVKASAAALLASDSAERQNSIRTRFEAAEMNLLLLSGSVPSNISLEEVTHVINYDLPSDTRLYFDMLRRVPDAIHINLVAPREEERVLEIEDGLGRPLFRDTLPNFDYTQPAPVRESLPRPEKHLRNSKARAKGKPRATKTEWDPEIPRTWGDRNAPRKDPDKTPLAEWSPEPLPAIWSEQKPSSTPTAPERAGNRRPRRRQRGRRGRRPSSKRKG